MRSFSRLAVLLLVALFVHSHGAERGSKRQWFKKGVWQNRLLDMFGVDSINSLISPKNEEVATGEVKNMAAAQEVSAEASVHL
jgi:hypothetical protein